MVYAIALSRLASSRPPWIAVIFAFFFCWSLWFRDISRGTFSEYMICPKVCQNELQAPFLANTQEGNAVGEIEDTTAEAVVRPSHKQKENATTQAVTQPSIERPLILYAFSESDEARINIQYFIDHGLHDAADFIFILNGKTDIHKIIPQKNNINHIQRPNDCFDLGSYAEVLTKSELYKKYRRFIMLNASLRGPFLPSWSRSCWSSLYLSRITPTTKLIGMTANCEPEFHIQSMIWATDLDGIQTLLFPPQDVVEKLPPRPMYAIKGELNKSEVHPPGINSCFRSFNAAINAEIGVTSLMRTAGYGVEAIMSAFHGVDTGDKEDSTDEKQEQSSDLTSEYERFCKSKGTGDLLYDGGYFGINIHPFETIFMKTNRNIGPVALDHLTNWMKGSGFNSYDNCKV